MTALNEKYMELLKAYVDTKRQSEKLRTQRKKLIVTGHNMRTFLDTFSGMMEANYANKESAPPPASLRHRDKPVVKIPGEDVVNARDKKDGGGGCSIC